MPGERRTLLIVDDDEVFARLLARAMQARGFACEIAADAASACTLAARLQPRYCVLDLKLGQDSGLPLVARLRAIVPGMRIVLATGYASIATTVEAIKRGAHDYLPKPLDADAVARTLLDDPAAAMAATSGPPVAAPLPLRRLEWEHIQRVLAECDGNVSAAARRLGMHRRSLQRKLAKHPVAERPAADDDAG